MEAILEFVRGSQNLSYNPVGSMWGGGWGEEMERRQAGCYHIWRGEWEEGGGEEVVLDKQAMFAYLPSAFSPPSISLLQFLLRLFLAGCEALSR